MEYQQAEYLFLAVLAKIIDCTLQDFYELKKMKR